MTTHNQVRTPWGHLEKKGNIEYIDQLTKVAVASRRYEWHIKMLDVQEEDNVELHVLRKVGAQKDL